MTLDPARRAGLERARALAIARDHFGVADGEVAAAPFGVAVADAQRTVVVVSSDDLAVLGGVLVWLNRREVTAADVVFAEHAGVHARRLAVLAHAASAWSLDGTSVSPAKPAPIDAPREVEGDVSGLVALIERSGGRAVTEDGIVRAEYLGLEVGRVVYGDGGPVLEVGVGRFDREAAALLHSGTGAEPSLNRVLDQVREHRRPGAPGHPIGRLARERWLRESLWRDRSAVGVVDAEFVEPIPPRRSLLDVVPAAMVGRDVRDGGRSVLVVCSVGADLGLVPACADLVAVHQPDEVRIALPERDHLPYLDALLASLPVAAAVVGVDPPWSDG